MENAKQLQTKVHGQIKIDSEKKDFALAFGKMLDSKNDIIKLMNFSGKTDSVSLSNIGKCDSVYNEENDPVKLKEHYFLADGIFMNIALNCATFNDQMFFVLCCNQHWLDVEYLKDLSNKMSEIFENITGLSA